VFRAAQARRAIPILAVAAALGGCMASAPSLTPQSGLIANSTFRAGLRPDAQHYGDDVVYSSQPYANDATVYRRKGTSLTPVETLSGIAAPEGTVATPNGLWYLTDAGNSNVLIYRTKKKGPKGPIGKLDDRGEIPVNVAVTADRDLVAVSNETSGSSGTGSVSVYLNQASRPSRTLTYGTDVLQGQGVAIDPNGNCFWSFDDESQPSAPGSIVEFAGCSGAGTLVMTPAITSAGGMTFDSDGDLYYIDEASGIYKCEKTASCQPFATGFGLPVNLNFDANGTNLWVADATGYIYAVDPNSGQIESKTISIDGDPYGIAPAPGN
jgi:DNA-binding beta-propeller fold protein YncE